MKKFLRWLSSASVIATLLLTVTVVSAQEDAVTVTTETDTSVQVIDDSATVVETDTEVTVEEDTALEGIEIDIPEELPSRVGLWFRGLRERASLTFTFDPVKKAEKQIKFAEERIAIAEKIGERTDDPDVQAHVDAMLERAQELIAKVEERKDEFLDNPDERKQRLLRNIATHQVRREEVLDRIEERLPEDKREQFEARREQLEEGGRRLLNAITNDRAPEAVREQLQNVKDRVEQHLEVNKAFREERRAILKEGRDTGDPAVVRDQLKELNDRRKETITEIRDMRKDKKVEFRNRAANGDEQAQRALQGVQRVEQTIQQRRDQMVEQRREVMQERRGADTTGTPPRPVLPVPARTEAGDREPVSPPVRPEPELSSDPAVRALQRTRIIQQRAEDHRDEVDAELNR